MADSMFQAPPAREARGTQSISMDNLHKAKRNRERVASLQALEVKTLDPADPAVVEIINRYYRERYTYWLRFVRAPAGQDVEDVLQEAFYQALLTWPPGGPECWQKAGTLDEWFSTILRRSLAAKFRDDIMRGATYHSPDDEVLSDAQSARHRLRNVEDCIQEEPLVKQRLLRFAIVEGKSAKEIAEELPYKEHSIRELVRQFRRKLEALGI